MRWTLVLIYSASFCGGFDGQAGKQMLKILDIEPGDLLLVGDTIHDFEVASELGCSCILVSHGHQSDERLKSTGVLVIEDLAQLMN